MNKIYLSTDEVFDRNLVCKINSWKNKFTVYSCKNFRISSLHFSFKICKLIKLTNKKNNLIFPNYQTGDTKPAGRKGNPRSRNQRTGATFKAFNSVVLRHNIFHVIAAQPQPWCSAGKVNVRLGWWEQLQLDIRIFSVIFRIQLDIWFKYSAQYLNLYLVFIVE